MTPISTPERRKSSNAAAVVASKNVGCTGNDARGTQTVGAAQDVLDRRFEQRGIDRTIVDDESFGEIAEVWRRISARPDSRGAQRRVGHGRDRSLSVRAGNVQRPERTLRMAKRLAEQRDVVEAQLDAEVLERE